MLRTKAGWLLSLVLTVGAVVTFSVKAAEFKLTRPADGQRGGVQPENPDASNNAAPDVQFFPLKPGAAVQRARASGGNVAGAADEKLIYSNTLGHNVLPLLTSGIIADDITINAKNLCPLRRLTFQVVGKADPAGTGGAFDVNYSLYYNCPQATTSPDPNILKIPDTSRTAHFTAQQAESGDILEVELVIPDEVTVLLTSTFWLGVTASRSNVGIVFGAPALEAFSNDIIDFPLQTCNADAGGFPAQPHASFVAEVFGDISCVDAFPGYRNSHPGRGGFSEGRSECFSDDVRLNVGTCQMVGYALGVRGTGQFRIAMRSDAGGSPGALIAGTARTLSVPPTSPPGSTVIRANFTTPIVLPPASTGVKVWVTFEAPGAQATWILTRKDADIGTTLETYAKSASGRPCSDMNTAPDWQIVPPPDLTAHGGFDVTIFCAGEPPSGACCDMFLRDDGDCNFTTDLCEGGQFDGQPCLAPIDCQGDAVCRDVPRMNCTFPPRDIQSYRPSWQPGKSCMVCAGGVNNAKACKSNADCPNGTCNPNPTDPFGNDGPCGVASCCTPQKGDCVNVTQKACDQISPAYEPNTRSWQIGRRCGRDQQVCPSPACLGREGDCNVARRSACVGGPLHGDLCNNDNACRGFCGQQFCFGGPRNGLTCTRTDPDCLPFGRCAQKCFGGRYDGLECLGGDAYCNDDLQCVDIDPAGGKVCIGGQEAGNPCLNTADCQGGLCSVKWCISAFDPEHPRNEEPCEFPRDCRGAICEGRPGCEDAFCCTDVCDLEEIRIGTRFCCVVTWDVVCAQYAAEDAPPEIPMWHCALPPRNNICGDPSGSGAGALEIPIGGSVTAPMNNADNRGDPGFCCHTGFQPICSGGEHPGDNCVFAEDCFEWHCLLICTSGPFVGAQCKDSASCQGAPCVPACLGGPRPLLSCAEDRDCNPGVFCTERTPLPGQEGEDVIWFRFEVPPKSVPSDPDTVSVRVHTCRSVIGDARDSILQVFATSHPDAGLCTDLGKCADGSFCDINEADCADGSRCDPFEQDCSLTAQDCPLEDIECEVDLNEACDHLVLLGCNDDAIGGCPENSQRPNNSSLCLPNLQRNQTYFIELGNKYPNLEDPYRVDVLAMPQGCGAQSIPNDGCPTASVVTTNGSVPSSFPFNLNLAGFDCPASTCLPSGINDVWFRYEPTSPGVATIETCGINAFDTPDTEMSVYIGCACPEVVDPRDADCCSGFVGGLCLNGSRCQIEVEAGRCYLIRIADRQGGRGQGKLTITNLPEDCNLNGQLDSCDVDCQNPGCAAVPGCHVTSLDCNNNDIPDECEGDIYCCPSGGTVVFQTPASGTIDARYPLDPLTGQPTGITQITVQAPADARSQCWGFCETNNTGTPNGMTVTDNGDETYTLTLDRPITPNACTVISYLPAIGDPIVATYIGHPANVNGDGTASSTDLQSLVNYLNGQNQAVNAPYGLFSGDIDFSGAITALDLLALINLLNGADPLDAPASGLPRPTCTSCLPN